MSIKQRGLLPLAVDHFLLPFLFSLVSAPSKITACFVNDDGASRSRLLRNEYLCFYATEAF